MTSSSRQLVGLLLLALCGRLPAAQSPLEQELRIRTWALASKPHEEELRAAIGSHRWELRHAAFEALERRTEFGGELTPDWLGLLRAGLDDVHPNVRARALRTLAAAHEPRASSLSPEQAESFARASLPLLRISLCEALARLECDVPTTFLNHLVHDPDERVRSAARTTLAGERPGGRSWSKATLLAHLTGLTQDHEDDHDHRNWQHQTLTDFSRFFTRLERSPLTPEEWSALDALPLHHEPLAQNQTFLGLIETLRFARTETGNSDTWLCGFRQANNVPIQELFLLASRSEHEGLARVWLVLLANESATRATTPTTTRALALGEVLNTKLTESLFHMLSPTRLAQLAREAELGEAQWLELLAELGHRSERFDPVLVRDFLTPGRATKALRLAMVEALGFSLDREGEAWRENARGLVLALKDPQEAVVERSLRYLLRCPDPRLFELEIFAAWTRLSEGQRDSLRGRFPRDVALTPFLSTWLALGNRRDRRREACELLRAFLASRSTSRDAHERMRVALNGWLTEYLRDFVTEKPPRGSELGVQAIVACMSAAAVHHLAAFDRVLEHSIGVSKDVTKAVVAALAKTPTGRQRLSLYLTPSFDDRTRVEAALHLLGSRQGSAVGSNSQGLAARAFEVVRSRYEVCDSELKRRMLRALEAYATDASLSFLAGFVFASRNSPEERALALSTLSKLDHPRRRSILRRAVSQAGDIEARLLAARALGRHEQKDHDALGALEDLRTALADVAQDVRLGEEERELLRSELILSMGRLGHPPDGGMLRAPLALARADMRARFEGRDLARVSFSWRTELYLAQALARKGRVGTQLDREPGWIELDGRFLISLGSVVLQAGEAPAGRRLLEAGLVASFGEAKPDHELRLEARSRLLGLAWREERYADAERLASSLLLEYRAGILPRAGFARAFGVFDPPAGIDPRGRLESARYQARAWRSLGRGEKEQARTLAAEARRRMGSSELALKEAERLEARLR